MELISIIPQHVTPLERDGGDLMVGHVKRRYVKLLQRGACASRSTPRRGDSGSGEGSEARGRGVRVPPCDLHLDRMGLTVK